MTSKNLTDERADKVTEIARELINSEDALLNQRFTWLIQIQGLLFTALGFAWKAAPVHLIVLLSVVGILVAISIYRAIKWHSPAIGQINDWWENLLSDKQILERRIIGYWNPSAGKPLERWSRPWRAMPIVFSVAWLGVILIRTLWAS